MRTGLMLRVFILGGALSIMVWSVDAVAESFHVEAAKSQVRFQLGDPLHAVNGTFRVEKGDLAFTSHDRTMSGTIVVDARSGESGNGTRDRKMTDDELKAGQFSTVTFAPSRYTGMLAKSGASTIMVEGVFTLLGTPHTITVPMQVEIDGARCTVTGSFPVPYVKWGLKDPSVLILRVGKEVTIRLGLVGSISGAAA